MRTGSFLKQSENVFVGNAGLSCADKQGLGARDVVSPQQDFHGVLGTPPDHTS